MRIPVLVSLTLVALATAACSSKSTGSSDPLTACKDLCTVEAMGTDCPSTTKASCDAICDNTDFTASSDCPTKAATFYNCAQDESWACSSGSDTPTTTDTSCDVEGKAWQTACTP